MQVKMLDIVEFARTELGVDTMVGIVTAVPAGTGMVRIGKAVGFEDRWIGQRSDDYGRVPLNRICRVIKPAPSFA